MKRSLPIGGYDFIYIVVVINIKASIDIFNSNTKLHESPSNITKYQEKK